MSPLQGLSDKHLLLKKKDKVTPGAKAEDVLAFRGLYLDADLYFTFAIEIKV
jgi:hypothetical protein